MRRSPLLALVLALTGCRSVVDLTPPDAAADSGIDGRTLVDAGDQIDGPSFSDATPGPIDAR